MGEETLDLTVCTPGWLKSRVEEEGIVDSRHLLVMDAFDFPSLLRYLESRVSACDGATWKETA